VLLGITGNVLVSSAGANRVNPLRSGFLSSVLTCGLIKRSDRAPTYGQPDDDFCCCGEKDVDRESEDS
jgi:hypothetical protein